MITLKNGHVVSYDSDFDQFFKNLLEAIIQESRNELEREGLTEEEYNEQFLKQIMDNCIFVTHQIFEMQQENQDLSRFMVTGFIFNSIIMTLPYLTAQEELEEIKEELSDEDETGPESDDDKIVH